MEKLKKIDRYAISLWLYASGRDLDIARYNLAFDDGDKENVITGLTLYLNDDGGFAKGLEPDIQSPLSNVPCTLQALYIIKETECADEYDSELITKTVEDALNYLFNHVTWFDGYLPLTSKEHNKFPSANWYKHESDLQSIKSMHPTIEAVSFALYFLPRDHEIYVRALNTLENIIDNILSFNNVNVYMLRAISLLTYVLSCRVPTYYAVELLTNNIENHLKKKFADDKQSLYTVLRDIINLGFGDEDIINDYLRYLVYQRLDSGLWDVTWNWGNDDSHFELVKLLWISDLAVSNLIFLKKFRLLEK